MILRRKLIKRLLAERGISVSEAALKLIEIRALRYLHEACGRCHGNNKVVLRAVDF